MQAEEFKVLTDREHVLKRANVYLGSTTQEPLSGIINYEYRTKQIVPALIKCVEEIFQNSIDEFIRTKGEFAKNISLTISETLEGTEICVSDDGRGIPQDKIDGKYRPELAWTALRAGSNFDDSTREGAGTNGMGAALANIFSTSFIGRTADGKNQITVTCSDNMKNVSTKTTRSTERGTWVQFIPDLDRLGLTEFSQDHIDVLQDRFFNLAIMYPKIQFSFNGFKIQFRNIKQVAKRFHESAVSYEQENVSFVFAPAGADEEFRCLSYTNGIYIKNGGSHVDYAMGKVIESLRAHIKKKHKIDVLPNQIRQHMMIASWITGFRGLRFDSQSKERITNSVAEVSVVFKDIDFDKISKQILDTPEIVDPIIAAILYKRDLADQMALAKKQKQVAKARIVKHIAATHEDPEKRNLLLCEGDSAIGPLIQVRDPKTTGGYPMRGKPLNVRDLKLVDIMKNTEIMELMSIIGLELGKPAVNLNYGKIYIFSDRDLDGDHIFNLLLNLFSRWPELFTQRRIYRLLSPLYYCTKGKQSKTFYNVQDFEQFNSKGWEVEYFKGLGSMPVEVYSDCVNNPNLECIVADDFSKLEMAFGEDSSLRKTWMMG